MSSTRASSAITYASKAIYRAQRALLVLEKMAEKMAEFGYFDPYDKVAVVEETDKRVHATEDTFLQLLSLKHVQVTDEVDKFSEQVEFGECAVCFEKLYPRTSVLMPCKHAFHTLCMARCITIGTPGICPLCRGGASMFEILTEKGGFLNRKMMEEAIGLHPTSTHYDEIDLCVDSIIKAWAEPFLSMRPLAEDINTMLIFLLEEEHTEAEQGVEIHETTEIFLQTESLLWSVIPQCISELRTKLNVACLDRKLPGS